MNPSIQKLFKIRGKSSRVIAGLRSGMSFDVLDTASSRFHGCSLQTELEVLCFTTVLFPSGFKEDNKPVFTEQTTNLQRNILLNNSISAYSGEIILQMLTDLVSGYGSTTFHVLKSASLYFGSGVKEPVLFALLANKAVDGKLINVGHEKGVPVSLYG